MLTDAHGSKNVSMSTGHWFAARYTFEKILNPSYIMLYPCHGELRRDFLHHVGRKRPGHLFQRIYIAGE